MMLLRYLYLRRIARRYLGQVVCFDGTGGPLLEAGWLGLTVQLADGDQRHVPYCEIDYLMTGPDVDWGYAKAQERVAARRAGRQEDAPRPALSTDEIEALLREEQQG